jgi:hypothetical protein
MLHPRNRLLEFEEEIMAEHRPKPALDTCQIGVTPVQVFVCQAIPVTKETALEPRLGRPVRTPGGAQTPAPGRPRAGEGDFGR